MRRWGRPACQPCICGAIAKAEGTGEFIAADYQFEVLPGVGHYAADQVPERVDELLLAHLAAHPV
jgi:hypothetical protein